MKRERALRPIGKILPFHFILVLGMGSSYVLKIVSDLEIGEMTVYVSIVVTNVQKYQMSNVLPTLNSKFK